MQIIETQELISINGTLLFQLISFLIFLFLINRIMLRPLRGQAGERQAHMEAISQDITKAQATCDELNHQMRIQEEEVRQAATAVRDQMEAEGKKTATILLSETREEINSLRSRAQKENEAKIAAVRQKLNVEAQSIATQMMASLLGRRIES